MIKLKFQPHFHSLNDQGIWTQTPVMMIGGARRSKGLSGFHPVIVEASRIIEEGGKVELTSENQAEVERYQQLKQILTENRWCN